MRSVAATVLGSGMAAVDATVVGIALPSIGRDFHVDVATFQWVVDAYTLRVVLGHGYCRTPLDYSRAKRFCERRLPRSLEGYQEFHALMVEHAKRLRAAASGKPVAG